jgi:protein-tyrosine kinase
VERIKNAIEKARTTRSKAEPHDIIKERTDLISRSESGGDLDRIEYNETRVVNLDPVHLEKNRIVAFNKNDPSSWVFDLLRTQVLRKMDENGWRTIAITSPTPESGKTLVSINLAMSIAQQKNRSSMLVDFDLRRPKVGRYLGLPQDVSLNNYFNGTHDVSEVLVNPGIPRFVVLSTKHPISDSSEMLSSNRIKGLISELKDKYESRVVIFDLPPILNSDDALAVLPHIDCVLMVVGNGMSTKKEIESSMRLMPSVNLIGTVLNKAEVPHRPYY